MYYYARADIMYKKLGCMDAVADFSLEMELKFLKIILLQNKFRLPKTGERYQELASTDNSRSNGSWYGQ